MCVGAFNAYNSCLTSNPIISTRVAIIGCVGPDENPASVRVLASAGFAPLASSREEPLAMIRYHDEAPSLDSVWLLNWNLLNQKLRAKAARHWEQ